MTLLKYGGFSGWDAKILATDLDSEVLGKARAGIYSSSEVDGLEESTVKNYFQHGGDGKEVKIKDKVGQFVHFKRLNLLEKWPMTGPFDFIFCRNVVIYFDKPTQKVLFERYADMLVLGGYLFIGHSENLHGISDRFENIGNTIYRKIR
jgi:chemotaxis protein methyltransferase CheR